MNRDLARILVRRKSAALSRVAATGYKRKSGLIQPNTGKKFGEVRMMGKVGHSRTRTRTRTIKPEESAALWPKVGIARDAATS